MGKEWKFKAVDGFLRLYTRRRGRLQPAHQLLQEKNFSHIVIYSTTALGDFMFNTPAIHAVRRRFPDAVITLVVHKKIENLVVGGRDWQHVICWNTKIKTVPQLVRDIKQIGVPDLAIILHSHDPYDYLSAILAGARYVLRDNYTDGITAMDRWLAGYIIGFNGHVIQRKLELVAMLGAEISNICMRIPFSVPEAERSHQGRVIGFQMGASTPERCWPVEYFAVLARQILTTDPTSHIVLTGWGQDSERVAVLLRLLEPELHSRISNKVGSTTLKALVMLINGMDVLVSGDTGPLHLAIALGVSTVSMFVTASHYGTGPYQNPELHDVIYGVRNNLNIQTDNIMSIITPQQVADRVLYRLGRLNGQKRLGAVRPSSHFVK